MYKRQVSSTAHIAHQAGIKVFATGGIGGVHRGYSNTLDMSQDLNTIKNTPLVIVCSGVKSFLDVEKGTHNFQSDKAIESITSGGFFGKGIGEGTLKNRVPEAHTDYIISVISEEFGVIAIILILILFLTFIFSVLKKVNNETDNKIKLILVGSISLILIQTMIHIGVNIRLFPTTGMTLPFLSYGGSSILSISILSGIILNLTKRRI